MVNSVFVAVMVTIGKTVLSLLAGLAFIYFRFPPDLSSETLPDILNRASDMLAQLTDNAWQEIYLDKEILWVKNVQNQSLRLIDLSTGTRDQLQLALRLAFIQSKNLDFPIFLDDNFLRFDQNRRRNFSNMLAEIAKERQVILLTSDQTLVPETKGTIKL